jgi:hypothetical protein
MAAITPALEAWQIVVLVLALALPFFGGLLGRKLRPKS